MKLSPRFLLIAAALIVVAGTAALAQVTSPTERDGAIAKRVALFLERVHIRGARPDDAMSERFFETFFSALDPQRVYFLASDVAEFAERRRDLDDDLIAGRVDFAFRVFRRFLERVDQRSELAVELAGAEHDFDADESIESDRSEEPFLSTDAEIRENWRKRVKLLLLEKVSDGIELADAREQAIKRYREFARRMHQMDNDELLQIYFSSATTTYDPHTTYMSPSTLEDFEISMKLELEGIGAALTSRDGFTVVTELIPGSAAHRDGRLAPQDEILAVAEGADGDYVDVVERKLSDVVKLIRGKAGTTVRLRVKHAASGEFAELVLERAKVELKSREARGEIILEERRDGQSSLRLGVIQLPSFYMDMAAASAGARDYKSTSRDVRGLIEGFKSAGIDALLIDLRYNSGGSLTEAIDLTGLFIDKGPIVQIKMPFGGVETKTDDEPGQVWSGPLIVLTNANSASASEIFAGAIQDYRRGLVVGDDATHGKGTVQQLLDISDRGENAEDFGAIKITVSQFYRPGGASTQSLGVVPDIVLPSVRNHLDLREANLDNALAFDRVAAARFDALGLVDDAMLAKLRASSEARRRESDFFQREARDIERVLAIKERKAIPLSRDRYSVELRFADRDDDVAKETEGETEGEDAPVIRRDGYFDEVLAITREYVELHG